jgi:universal stress protein A
MKRICAWCGRVLDSRGRDDLPATHGVCPACRVVHFPVAKMTVSTVSRFPIRRILVPIDWSEPSKKASRLAASLAREERAQLVLLHVVPVAVVMNGPPPANYLKHLREELRQFEPSHSSATPEYLVTEGDPVASILGTAREYGCDLIVMGTHGRSGLTRFLMGSVAEEVVRKSACPVLTLRVPKTTDKLQSAVVAASERS